VHDLVGIVGSEHVREGVELADASGLPPRPATLVAPGDAQEVAAVVGWCYGSDVPIVPFGGGTGFAGGAMPVDGGIVLSLGRLDRVRSLDPLLWRAEVEAGVTTATVARLARENGLFFGVDPGAAEQSTIGGNVATNAGGPHAFKHGVTRAWVTGLEAVLAPGELVRLGGAVRKDVAGYDLVSLLCGSEGTLGVVTAVWLRLLPAPEAAIPLVATYPDARAGQAALEAVLACGAVPSAIEFVDAGALAAAGRSGAFMLIAEADREADVAPLAQALGANVERPDPRELWRWRDGVSIAVTAHRGRKLSEDIAVPLDRLAEAVEGTLEIGARHGLEACSWGHAGDGNVHATFMLGPGEEAGAAAEELFALAVELGGTVSGEHGLGLLKAGQLRRQWPPAAVAAHEAIKRALDPKGLLNPGKKAA